MQDWTLLQLLKETVGHLLWPVLATTPTFALWHRNLLRKKDGTIIGIIWLIFPSLWHCLPSLPNVQCLENYYFVYFVFFIISGRGVNMIAVIPSWPEAKATGFIFNNNI